MSIRRLGIAAVALACWCVAGCTSVCRVPGGAVNHVVLATLNDPGERASLERETGDMLAQVRGVRAFGVGRPLASGRPVVDSSYDVGFWAVFEDRAAYEAYEHDPAHERLLAAWKPRVKQLRIFDFAGE